MTVQLMTPEARQKAETNRLKTLENYRKLANEDILICRGNGMVPLAIADRLGVSLRRVVAVLRDAGEPIPGYLFTSNEPPRGECCPTCGR